MGDASGPVSFSGPATLQPGTANLALSGQRNISLAGGVTAAFDTQGNGMSVPGIISGSGGLLKAGSGTLSLAGSNSYSGGTTVSAGTLQLGNAAARSASSAPLTLASGRLDLAGYSPAVGVLSGSGGTITSPAAAVLTTTIEWVDVP